MKIRIEIGNKDIKRLSNDLVRGVIAIGGSKEARDYFNKAMDAVASVIPPTIPPICQHCGLPFDNPVNSSEVPCPEFKPAETVPYYPRPHEKDI